MERAERGARELATSYSRRGQYREAIQVLTELLHAYPQSYLGWIQRGNLFHNHIRDYHQAVMDYSHAIQLDPSKAVGYNNLGNSFNAIHEYHTAIRHFTTAIVINPAYANAFNNRGFALDRLHLYDEAIADLTRTIEIDPQYISGYVNRAYSYDNCERFLEAIADYTRAIELDGNDAIVFNNRAHSYRNLRRYEEAIVDYSRALEISPNTCFSMVNRARVLQLVGRFDAARGDLHNAIDKFDSTLIAEPGLCTEALISRGRAHRFLGEHEQALEDLTNAAKEEPHEWIAKVHRAFVLEDLGRHIEASMDLEKAAIVPSGASQPRWSNPDCTADSIDPNS